MNYCVIINKAYVLYYTNLTSLIFIFVKYKRNFVGILTIWSPWIPSTIQSYEKKCTYSYYYCFKISIDNILVAVSDIYRGYIRQFQIVVFSYYSSYTAVKLSKPTSLKLRYLLNLTFLNSKYTLYLYLYLYLYL